MLIPWKLSGILFSRGPTGTKHTRISFSPLLHPRTRNTVHVRFTKILAKLLKEGQLRVGGFGDILEKVKKILLRTNPKLINNDASSCESFRNLRPLCRGFLIKKGKGEDHCLIWEKNTWIEPQNARNYIRDELMKAYENCSPKSHFAKTYPDNFRSNLQAYVDAWEKKEEDWTEEEKTASKLPILFFDDPAAEEKFLAQMQNPFPYISYWRSTDSLNEYTETKKALDIETSYLAFRSPENKETYVAAFAGRRANDGERNLEPGDFEIQRPDQDGEDVHSPDKTVKADYPYRDPKHPDYRLDQWHIGVKDPNFIIKQLHLSRDGYRHMELGSGLPKYYKCHDENEFPQHDQKKGDDHWFAVKNAIFTQKVKKVVIDKYIKPDVLKEYMKTQEEKEKKEWKKKKKQKEKKGKGGEEKERETIFARYERTGELSLTAELRGHLSQAKGISFAKDPSQTLPAYFLEMYPLPEGFEWIRTVEDVRRVLDREKYWLDYLLLPKTAKRNFWCLHLNYNRAPRKLQQIFFLWSKNLLSVMMNMINIIFPWTFSLVKRIVAMSTETYVFKAGEGPPPTKEGWNKERDRFDVLINGNHENLNKAFFGYSKANKNGSNFLIFSRALTSGVLADIDEMRNCLLVFGMVFLNQRR